MTGRKSTDTRGRKRIRIRKLAAVAALLLGIGCMAYAGVNLYETDQIYREGNEAYDSLRGRVRGGGAAGGGAGAGDALAAGGGGAGGAGGAGEAGEAGAGSGGGSGGVAAAGGAGLFGVAGARPVYAAEGGADGGLQGPSVYIPDLGIDFQELKAVGSDITAWLYSPDTAIDYPVMQASDYSYYLNHLPDGTVNANGSLFTDFSNAPDFGGRLTVIYGHNMKSGKMFGSLTGYKAQSYYDEHPYMYIYTERGDYRLDLMYGCVIGAGQWRERAFMFEENADSLLAYAAYNTTFKSGVELGEGDRIVALSTCSYEFDDARYVVLGILRN